MSEEDLSEGSLGLRARGSARTVAHGQVLVQGSDETGEAVEEEEAPEDIQASLLQLLDQDLLACDVQLSLFVAAASSYRQVTFCCFFFKYSLRSGHNTSTVSSILPDQQWRERCGGTSGWPGQHSQAQRCPQRPEREFWCPVFQTSKVAALGVRRGFEVEVFEHV